MKMRYQNQNDQNCAICDLVFVIYILKGVVKAWIISLFVDIIVIAPSDNIFVNKSGGGIERSPMSRHKQGKMAKNV